MALVVSVLLGQLAASTQVSAQASEVTPRGQRDVKDITYGDWKKLCFRPGGEKQLCRTSISGTFATGQVAVRVDIIDRGDSGARRIQIFAPVGMYLPIPVKVTIDRGKPYHVPYTWCLTNTCLAGAVAGPALLKDMAKGQTLRLEFVDSNILSLATSLPLAPFAAAHNGAPAQTFEQDINE